jgi:methylenetetrahydrofolate dehydrogenase (NADP+)/methenyltetrahydrofolate cyclohydrolase
LETTVETRILEGKPIARAIREDVAARAAALAGRGAPAKLAIVMVGDDPGSAIYSKSLMKAAGKVGIEADLVEVPGTASADEVAQAIRAVDDDPAVTGIIVQQPLPKGIPSTVIEEVSPAKDVDCATVRSLGLLMAGRESFAPATALAVIEVLAASGIPVSGQNVAIVGRSTVVGRPLASLLLRKSDRGNATVTVCHTRTKDIAAHTRAADIVVAAMGVPEAITGDMIAEGSIVIDVGTNRVDAPDTEKGYRIVGDVAYDEVVGRAAAVTPVPGGVGSLTTAILLRNTVEAGEPRETP